MIQFCESLSSLLKEKSVKCSTELQNSPTAAASDGNEVHKTEQ